MKKQNLEQATANLHDTVSEPTSSQQITGHSDGTENDLDTIQRKIDSKIEELDENDEEEGKIYEEIREDTEDYRKKFEGLENSVKIFTTSQILATHFFPSYTLSF